MYPVLFHIGPFVIPTFGVLSALGVLLGLFLAQCTARVTSVNAAQVWNLCVVGLFSALIVQRLLLVLLNWSDIRLHPQWMIALSMIHHPLLTGVGALAGAGAAALYVHRNRMPLAATADALGAPLALGLACEQLGALFAGSSYGTAATVRWAVTYTNPLAARWSGTPLGIPLHPVQAYAGLALLTLALLLTACLPVRKQPGDVAGLWLLGMGVTIYITEMWRDPEGRGTLLHGAIDAPQLVAVVFVLAGGSVLRERKKRDAAPEILAIREDMREASRLAGPNEFAGRDEAQHD